jgi:hypothetical protein
MLIDNPNSKTFVADWVEFYVCATKNGLSKSELLTYIEDSSGSEPDATFIDDVWQELEIRLSLYGGEKPPYEVNAREIISLIDWESHPEYLVCVILSIDGNAIDSVSTGKLFERLSCKAVKKYFNGEAVIYGFPQKQTVEEISLLMNETFSFNPSSNFKDRGVDIICWKPFGDKRKSQISAIIQCAAGFNWKGKLLSIPVDAWRQYILWSGSLPIKGFTTPTIINEDVFHDVVTDSGLMFDRPRLYRNLQHENNDDANLQNDLINWCTSKISNLTAS